MTFFVSVSIYIGMFLYINGMVTDMQMRMKSINDNDSMSDPRQLKNWAILVEEMKLHLGIIRYSLSSTESLVRHYHK